MKYIIMCGGVYHKWQTPRQLIKINNEPLVARTIRLLKENSITDIAISSNNKVFQQFNVPVLKHKNTLEVNEGGKTLQGLWVECFYPTKEPTCYLFGDVVYSQQAIKTIINTDTNDIEFFASAPPFANNYIKKYAEPFAFKVVNLQHFQQSIQQVKTYYNEHKFSRDPIAWELWQVIKKSPLNKIIYTNYTIINDYTCDIDSKQDIQKFEQIKGEI